MPDYRDFAESLFSSVIWANEGRLLLVFGIVIIIAAGTLFLHGLISSQTKFSRYALILLGVFAVGMFMSSSSIVNSVNKNVAKHNIAVKYQTSDLQFLSYSNSEGLLTARYTDKNSNFSEVITFAFVKDNTEPFLIKRNNTEQNFRKIEKDIFKPLPKIMSVSDVK